MMPDSSATSQVGKFETSRINIFRIDKIYRIGERGPEIARRAALEAKNSF